MSTRAGRRPASLQVLRPNLCMISILVASPLHRFIRVFVFRFSSHEYVSQELILSVSSELIRRLTSFGNADCGVVSMETEQC